MFDQLEFEERTLRNSTTREDFSFLTVVSKYNQRDKQRDGTARSIPIFVDLKWAKSTRIQ